MAKIVREAPQSTKLLQADDGAAAIEYGLLGALIAGVLLFGLSALSATLNGKPSQLASAITVPQSASPGNNGKGGNGNGNGGPSGGSAG